MSCEICLLLKIVFFMDLIQFVDNLIGEKHTREYWTHDNSDFMYNDLKFE